jgi:quinol monooxygenase YgiN
MSNLLGATGEMPGAISYIMPKDATDVNAVWVTEIWDSEASHAASLTMTAVKDTIARCRPMIVGFEKVAVTSPVGESGMPAKHRGC